MTHDDYSKLDGGGLCVSGGFIDSREHGDSVDSVVAILCESKPCVVGLAAEDISELKLLIREHPGEAIARLAASVEEFERVWDASRVADQVEHWFSFCEWNRGPTEYFRRAVKEDPGFVERVLRRALTDDLVQSFTHDEFLDGVKVLLNSLQSKTVKKKITRRRRNAFSSVRDAAFLSLIHRDGYKCASCESGYDLTVDHVTPLSKGGSDDLSNLQLLCAPCNSSKGDRTA